MVESSKTKLDQKLFEQFSKLPIFPFYQLIQPDLDFSEKEKQLFFETGKTPTFRYPKAKSFNIDEYLKKLNICRKNLKLIKIEKWILNLYLDKLDELKIRANIIKAIQENNDKKVSQLSKKLFGNPTFKYTQLKNEFNEMISLNSKFFTHTKPINAKKFKSLIIELLDYYNMQNWNIKFSDRTSMKLGRGRNGLSATIWIPKKLKISKARAKRLLIHEIEVHALRTQNGINSPLHILRIGLDQYLETDEGLAIYFQSLQSKKKFDPGFWESYTCALTKKYNFKETFDELFNARKKLDKVMSRDQSSNQQKDRAWNLCMRAYRGISNPDKPKLGTYKDHVYRSGLQKIKKIDVNNPKILKQLFAGNIGIKHLNKIKKLDLSYVQTPKLKSLKLKI